MLCIGLTGTIASGKSFVASAFSKLGVEIIDADKIARELTQKGTTISNKIINHFGNAFVMKDGSLDRLKLRCHIMTHPQAKKWLENLLHPEIRQEIKKRINKSTSNYCIIDIPLLNDKKNYPYLNRVLLVESEPELQIARIMARDKCTRKVAIIILKNQEENNTRQLIADDVIYNNSTTESLIQKVQELHKKYLNTKQK